MGLFNKKSPAEKKLKEITGGFLLSNEFMDRLKARNIPISVGNEIQSKVKEDIKNGNIIEEEAVEIRINYLIDLHSKSFFEAIESKKLRFLINQEHNVINCSKCNTKVLNDDKFCFNCGAKVIVKQLSSSSLRSVSVGSGSSGSVGSGSSYKPYYGRNTNLSNSEGSEIIEEIGEVLDELLSSKPTLEIINESNQILEENKIESTNNSKSDELSELEAIYNKTQKEDELSKLGDLYTEKVSADYSSSFKFAYVLYLNEINKHPSKKFSEIYKDNYKVSIAKLKKQAKDDGFIQDGSPLATAKDATVKDIKKVLKKYDLKVSGRKDELIERLGENLSPEELKKAFPKKSFELTKDGLEFLNSHKYVLYYDKNFDLKFNISPDDFDSIFTNDYEDNDLYDLIIEFLKERENNLIKQNNWKDYGSNLRILVGLYKDKEDEDNLLDYYFKSFIFDLNNYSEYSNKCEPNYAYLEYDDFADLIELMHSLSLELNILKNRFKSAFDELKSPTIVSIDDCLIFLLKAFSGKDVFDLNKEFRLKYGGES